jgi:hypothetical protein
MTSFTASRRNKMFDLTLLDTMTSEDFRALSNDDIRAIFRDYKYRRLDVDPAFASSDNAKSSSDKIMPDIPNARICHPNNVIYAAKHAVLSNDGSWLASPTGVWPLGANAPAIYIRESYTDHWEIIADHFGNTANFGTRVLISGTPGVGKSVEGFYMLFKILGSNRDNAPPLLYAASGTTSKNSKLCLAHIRGMYFQIDDFTKFEATWAYEVMKAHGPCWNIYDSASPSNRHGWKSDGPSIPWLGRYPP